VVPQARRAVARRACACLRSGRGMSRAAVGGLPSLHAVRHYTLRPCPCVFFSSKLWRTFVAAPCPTPLTAVFAGESHWAGLAYRCSGILSNCTGKLVCFAASGSHQVASRIPSGFEPLVKPTTPRRSGEYPSRFACPSSSGCGVWGVGWVMRGLHTTTVCPVAAVAHMWPVDLTECGQYPMRRGCADGMPI